MQYQFPFLDQEPRESVFIKCTECKIPTEHTYIKVVPYVDDIDAMDPMELLKKGKRLTLCTECGTLRLTN